MEGALLSVSGTAADDVWAVGSNPGDGPAVLHWDGADWNRIAVDVHADLWWVHPGPEHVWMAGDTGTVLRYSRATSTVEQIVTPTDLRLFGVYAFTDDDVWAVGGDPAQQRGIVLHYDGAAFEAIASPDAASEASWFKVWGDAPDDLWVVGFGGAALHWDGQALTTVPVPEGRPLLTVHGYDEDVIAVGGFGTGLVVQIEPGALVDDTPPVAPQFNGVFVTSTTAWIAGNQGALWERRDGTWYARDDAPPVPQDYHAVYVDPEDGVWAVGGDVIAPPLRRGLLTYFGSLDP
jgi:hypothetical protein